MNPLAQVPGQGQGPINNPALGPTLQGKSGADFFAGLLPAIIGLGLLVGVLIFIGVMMLGAIQWMNSGGDKAGIEGARNKIVGALFGVVLLFAVFAIVKVIEGFFGINILSIDISSFGIK